MKCGMLKYSIHPSFFILDCLKVQKDLFIFNFGYEITVLC